MLLEKNGCKTFSLASVWRRALTTLTWLLTKDRFVQDVTYAHIIVIMSNTLSRTGRLLTWQKRIQPSITVLWQSAALFKITCPLSHLVVKGQRPVKCIGLTRKPRYVLKPKREPYTRLEDTLLGSSMEGNGFIDRIPFGTFAGHVYMRVSVYLVQRLTILKALRI